MPVHGSIPAGHPAGPERRRTSVWVRLAVVVILATIGWCVWLLYPVVWVRICAGRVASFYEAKADPDTGQVTDIVSAPRPDSDRLSYWELELSNQPMPRLLALLDSGNPVWVFVATRAIEQQLIRGRQVGWPGKFEPVDPLDAAAAEAMLAALDRDLPRQLKTDLEGLLRKVSPDAPGVRQVFLRAAERNDPWVRMTACLALEEMDLDSDATYELALKLLQDPAPNVRAAVVSTVFEIPSKRPGTTLPARYVEALVAATEDAESDVRAAAARGLHQLNLADDATFELARTLWADPSPQVRRSVLSGVADAPSGGRRDPVPERYVELLWAGLEDPDPQLRRDISIWVVATRSIAPERQWLLVEEQLKTRTIPELAHRLAQRLFGPEVPPYRGPVQDNLAEGVERLRPLALEARPRLIEWAMEAIESEDELTAHNAVELLASVAPDDADRLNAGLLHPSPQVRIQTLQRLADICYRNKATSEFTLSDHLLARVFELLSDSDADVRPYAVHALSTWQGRLSQEQIAFVVEALDRVEPASAYCLFRTLQKHAAEHPALVQVAIRYLGSDEPETREWGAWHLAELGSRAAEALPQLLAGVRSARLGGWGAAAVAAAGVHIESPEDTRLLIRTLFDGMRPPLPSGPARASPGRPTAPVGMGSESALKTLGELVPLCPRQAVVESLLDELGHEDETVRREVAKLIAELADEPNAVVGRLILMLNSEPIKLRHGTALALAAFGLAARPAAPSLIQRLGEPDNRVRMAVAHALGAIGPEAGPDAAAALAKMAQHDRYPGAQAAAIRALAQLGPLARPWTGVLERLRQDRELMLRETASQALTALNREE